MRSCFNPCKGFRCFEAKQTFEDGLKQQAIVSIPVRVLDVLKQDRAV